MGKQLFLERFSWFDTEAKKSRFPNASHLSDELHGRLASDCFLPDAQRLARFSSFPHQRLPGFRRAISPPSRSGMETLPHQHVRDIPEPGELPRCPAIFAGPITVDTGAGMASGSEDRGTLERRPPTDHPCFS